MSELSDLREEVRLLREELRLLRLSQAPHHYTGPVYFTVTPPPPPYLPPMLPTWSAR